MLAVTRLFYDLQSGPLRLYINHLRGISVVLFFYMSSQNISILRSVSRAHEIKDTFLLAR